MIDIVRTKSNIELELTKELDIIINGFWYLVCDRLMTIEKELEVTLSKSIVFCTPEDFNEHLSKLEKYTSGIMVKRIYDQRRETKDIGIHFAKRCVFELLNEIKKYDSISFFRELQIKFWQEYVVLNSIDKDIYDRNLEECSYFDEDKPFRRKDFERLKTFLTEVREILRLPYPDIEIRLSCIGFN